MRRLVRITFAALAVTAWFCSSEVASGATATVVITSGGVQPASLSIEAGTPVTFRNDDGVRHRMRSVSGATEFDTGDLDPGDSFTVTFSAAGETRYRDERQREAASFQGSIAVGGGGGGSGPAPAPSAPSAPPAGAADVAIVDRAFSPASVSIAEGGTVRWTNRDSRAHTATGSGFDSGDLGSGATFSFTFPSAGSFSYRCDLHPEMTGVVNVGAAAAANPAPAPPPTTTSSVAPAPPVGREVYAIDFAFTPARLEATIGDTVKWTNRGQAPHTVTGTGFDSGRLAAGGTFTRQFTSAGTFAYRCDLHPEMTGSIVVGTAPVTASSPPAPPPPTTAPQAPPPPEADVLAAAAPTSARVELADFEFRPASVSVAPGGVVTFANIGKAPHTATADDESFDTAMLQAGEEKTLTFATEGSFTYTCVVHPGMKGRITVSASPPPAAETPPETVAISSSRPEPPRPSRSILPGLLGGAAILAATGLLLFGGYRFYQAAAAESG